MTSDDATQAIDHLLAECRRVEEFAQTNAAVHYVHAERAGLVAKILAAVPSAVGAGLGAIVALDPGLTAAGAGHWFAAAAVVVAGVLSSVLTALSPDKSRLEHSSAGGHYKTLENEARRAHEIYALEESKPEFLLRVRDLTRRYDDLGESSPPTEDWAYQRAVKQVKSGTYRPG